VWLIPLMVVGAFIGMVLAKRVEMTSMPQLVAMLHSFVGLAAVLVGLASYLKQDYGADDKMVHEIEILLGVFIGGVTFTGSIIAFGKLRGSIGSKPLLLPGRHLANAVMVVACIWPLSVQFIGAEGTGGLTALIIVTVISFVLGVHLIMAIGGADMPVVVSMLNSYSGWAAAASGFMLDNDLLIITGALVGSSGAILSYIMCRAMNRSLANVIFGGFGTSAGATPAGGEEQGTVTETTAEEVADMMNDAGSVVFVPGYGMAVAQAQHALREMADELKKAGVTVTYAIHPVAGRMPGHMNVLLAEANVPYEEVFELEEINSDFPTADVAFVIGANDVTNPAAHNDPQSPIAGMPILDVEKAKTVLFVKRSLSPGYAGIDNEVFYQDDTMMLFGDAKKMVEEIVKAL